VTKLLNRTINLMSDTQTKPTIGMRQAMAHAEVGDEQLGLDPTVNELCSRIAEMLGYEAALFAPSGTMCNQIGILVHCSAGDEIICDASSHVVNTEGAGAAALAGAAIRPLMTKTGIFGTAELISAVRTPGRTGPRSRLVSVEQTVNFLGGRAWSIDQLKAITATAAQHGLSSHLDGARLFNAAIATGTEPAAHSSGAGFSTAWVDLSKGLGCPVGAVLCGSKATIEEAWRWKYRLGGAMRQAGILAAAGIYALDHHLERLEDDHAHARILAEGIAAWGGHLVDPAQVETNIVLIDTTPLGVTAAEFAHACRTRGVWLSVIGPSILRAITHLDVDGEDILDATAIIGEVAHLSRTQIQSLAADGFSVARYQ
jgi:threonine aldolase